MIRFISLGRDGIHITSVPCTTSCCPPGSPAKHRCRSSSCLRSSSAMAASFNFRWISSSFFFPYTSWWIYKGYIAKLKRHEKCTSDHFWTCAQGSNIWLGSSSGINFKSNCQWPNIWIVPDSWVATTIKPRPQIKTRPQCSYTSRILCAFQEDLHIQTNLIKSLITGSWSPSPTYFHIIRPFHKTTPTDPPNYQLPSLIIHYIRCSYNTYIYIYIYTSRSANMKKPPRPSPSTHQPMNHTKRLTCFRQVFSVNQLLWSVHCAQRRWEASVRCFAASFCLGGIPGATTGHPFVCQEESYRLWMEEILQVVIIG